MTSKLTYWGSIGLAAASVVVANPAFAAGTTAGASITNTATVTYQVGGVAQGSQTASDTFTVDRKINLTVAEVGTVTTNVVPGQTNAVTTFQLTNNSNEVLDFAPAPDGRSVALVRNLGKGADASGIDLWLVGRDGGGLRQLTTDGFDLIEATPAWSPDSAQIVYQRFLGYQALVDINLSEIGGSLEGKGKLLADGAGWMLPARFAPGGGAVALVENNYSDARGFGGYDNWSVEVLTLAGTHEIALPEGTLSAVGQRIGQLARAQAAAWSPDGAALAVLLPPGWNPNLPSDEPVGGEDQPGEIWRWRPGSPPERQLAANVDPASPVFWLAAAQ